MKIPRLFTVGCASAGVMAAAAAVVVTLPDNPSRLGETAVVIEAPFRVTLVERGAIDAARVSLYGSTIAGAQAKILEIVPEGSAVQPGAVLIRFDPAPFEQNVARESATLAQADAELLRAREDLRLEELRGAADTDAARDQVGVADQALVAERDGKAPLAVAEAEAAASDAARELDRARSNAADLHELLKQGFVTRIEVERADQTWHQAEERQRIATLRLATLKTFQQPAAIDKSRADVTAAQKNLAASTEAARSRLTQRRALVALADARAIEASLRLAQARQQVARTQIRSDTAGLVVHRELYFGTEKRKPQPGDEVWPNQPLVAIPDPNQLIVQTRVRELDLHKLSSSQRVVVAVDAYPGLALPATVSMIGALAQEDATRAGAKFFPVTIKLDAPDARLRTGMTARVEIEVSSLPKALVVPIGALVETDGITRCVVRTPHGTSEVRDVTVAARNELVAAVSAGLNAGERVVLNTQATR